MEGDRINSYKELLTEFKNLINYGNVLIISFNFNVLL